MAASTGASILNEKTLKSHVGHIIFTCLIYIGGENVERPCIQEKPVKVRSRPCLKRRSIGLVGAEV